MIRLAFALWLAALSPDPVMQQPPPVPPPDSAATGSMTSEEATAMTRDIAAKVAVIRGLPFKQDVPVRIVDDAAARRHFQELTDLYWPKDKMLIDQAALTQLGLLPEGYDIREGLFTVLEEQAAGYYDLKDNVFCVLNDMPRLSAPIIIAHELTHALDDQHFDIDAMLQAHMEAADRSSALAAVVEGSGIAVMTRFMMQEMTAGRLTMDALMEIQQSEAGQGARLKAAPQILQNDLLAPYIIGQTFLLRGNLLTGLMKGFKSEDIDRAFKNPPLSTEQILHPAKYWDDGSVDAPRNVVLPDLASSLGEGWTLSGDGDLGELALATLTGAPPVDVENAAAVDPSSWTNEAASGWDGDRWQHYGNGERRVTLFASLWDSDADAAQFAEAVQREGRTVRVSGDVVVLVAGNAGDAAATLAGRALEALTARAAPAP